MSGWKDGDDIDHKAAKEATKRLLEDPKHKRAKGHPDDEVTRDDALDDPRFNEGDDE